MFQYLILFSIITFVSSLIVLGGNNLLLQNHPLVQNSPLIQNQNQNPLSLNKPLTKINSIYEDFYSQTLYENTAQSSNSASIYSDFYNTMNQIDYELSFNQCFNDLSILYDKLNKYEILFQKLQIEMNWLNMEIEQSNIQRIRKIFRN